MLVGCAILFNVELYLLSAGIFLTLIGCWLLLVMRRMYWAVGTDWVYARRSSFRRGRWTALSQITSIAITNVGGTPYLRVKVGHRKIFDLLLSAKFAPNRVTSR